MDTRTLLAYGLNKVRNEPAIIIGTLAALIIYLAGSLGIVLDEVSVEAILTPVVTALLTRMKVVPTNKVQKPKKNHRLHVD